MNGLSEFSDTENRIPRKTAPISGPSREVEPPVKEDERLLCIRFPNSFAMPSVVRPILPYRIAQVPLPFSYLLCLKVQAQSALSRFGEVSAWAIRVICNVFLVLGIGVWLL